MRHGSRLTPAIVVRTGLWRDWFNKSLSTAEIEWAKALIAAWKPESGQ